VIIIGLASVIVGTSIFPSRTILLATLACLFGAILYRFAVGLALNADFIGLQASDVQLATAVLVALTLIGQRSGGTLRRRFSRAEGAGPGATAERAP